MKLLTKEIRKKLPALYSTEETPLAEKVLVVKFFSPWTHWTWYAVEAESDEEDVRFFGLVDGDEVEWGYFLLSELESVRGPMGLRIERDLWWTPGKAGDVLLRSVLERGHMIPREGEPACGT